MNWRTLSMKKRRRPATLFSKQKNEAKVFSRSTSLLQLNTFIDWEDFREVLELSSPISKRGKGGRPAYDRVFLFKILVLQALHELSDAQTELQILDRISFRAFLDLDECDEVPDQNTIWNFREQLTKANALGQLFEDFYGRVAAAGFVASKGIIVDASIVQVPIQRNSKEENKLVKEGTEPEGWTDKKSSHKDTDATWTSKHGKSYFGYKNTVKVNAKTKVIEDCVISTASPHDSQLLDKILVEEDRGRTLYADSAYSSTERTKDLKERGITNRIHKKAARNTPLSEYQQAYNRKKSKVRCRVEHVFAALKSGPTKMFLRCIGFERVTSKIVLANLVYNFQRICFLQKQVNNYVPI